MESAFHTPHGGWLILPVASPDQGRARPRCGIRLPARDLADAGRHARGSCLRAESMVDTIIVGAGISGLSCAWFLRERGHRIRVLEAGPRPGGTIQSVHQDGFLIEAGPNTTLLRDGPFGEL